MSWIDDYYGDVIYDVWREGENPDLVDYDRTMDDFYDDLSPEESANKEIGRQRLRESQFEEEYPSNEDDF